MRPRGGVAARARNSAEILCSTAVIAAPVCRVRVADIAMPSRHYYVRSKSESDRETGVLAPAHGLGLKNHVSQECDGKNFGGHVHHPRGRQSPRIRSQQKA